MVRVCILFAEMESMKRTFAFVMLANLLATGMTAQAETLRERKDAPEAFQLTYSSKTFRTDIVVDAVVALPDAEQIHTYPQFCP